MSAPTSCTPWWTDSIWGNYSAIAFLLIGALSAGFAVYSLLPKPASVPVLECSQEIAVHSLFYGSVAVSVLSFSACGHVAIHLLALSLYLFIVGFAAISFASAAHRLRELELHIAMSRMLNAQLRDIMNHH